MMSLLLKKGADRTRKNKAGKTAGELARAAGYDEIAELLK
jgi:ankyrin repeat protein